MALYTDLNVLPYQQYLLGKTYARPILYHNENPALSLNVDEWEYMRIYATFYDSGGIIPLSQL